MPVRVELHSSTQTKKGVCGSLCVINKLLEVKSQTVCCPRGLLLKICMMGTSLGRMRGFKVFERQSRFEEGADSFPPEPIGSWRRTSRG